MKKVEAVYAAHLEQRRQKNLYRSLSDFRHFSAREMEVSGTRYINFSSNDYLGLSFHPEIIRRAAAMAEMYGAGSGASRLVTGNVEIFSTIENKIAVLKGREAALVMVSGYQANVSVLSALFDKTVLGAEPLVFADKLNHASMHAGCAAAGVSQIRYRHNDVAHLETLLKTYEESDRPKFILTESVFSMDGDVAPLDALAILAEKYNAFLVCDEAHATGVLGAKGRGLADKADMVIGMFGKAMGSFGAYVACSETLKNYLVNCCGGVVYATALPPTVLGSIDAALDLLPDMDAPRAHVQALAARFRDRMKAAGFDVGQSQTQIVPLMMGSEDRALALSAHLKANGLWATAIRPPTVPVGTSRIRFAFSAAHTDEDVNRLIDCLVQTA